MMKFANPNTIGVAKSSSMIVPCMVNSWLYCSLEKNCSPGRASSARISSASTPPSMKNANEVTMYISPIWKILTTTDHKTIGLMYLITSFAFFMLGGVLALLMRAELARPGLQFFSNEQYNQLFTMHGTIMLLMFATPIVFGFANFIMPLQIGSPDVSFPRLNALSYWLYLFGSLIAVSGFLTPEGAADFGWFAYAPLNSVIHSPNVGGDLWIVGLTISGLGTILGAVNMITTILTLRAPGMTMFRMPVLHLEHPGDLDHGY